jgi:predicted dehydrogenase
MSTSFEPGGGSPRLLRAGVIGLGPRWRGRYRRALAALAGSFQVSAVCDQVAERAVAEARQLECAAAAVAETVERPDVDVLLLPDPQWFGLWPLGLAGRAGKPALCCGRLALDPEADTLRPSAGEGGPPVMVEMPLHFHPGLTALRDLLSDHLGAPRMVLAAASLPERPARDRAEAERYGPALGWLHWCGGLLEGEPTRIQAAGLAGGELDTVTLDHGDGRAAHLTVTRAGVGRPSWRVQVIAEGGTAVAESSGTVSWEDASGNWSRTVRQTGAGREVLQAFHRAVSLGEPPRPSLADVGRTVRWLRRAGMSRAEGVAVSPAG